MTASWVPSVPSDPAGRWAPSWIATPRCSTPSTPTTGNETWGERAALEQVRSGNVGIAADWYHERGKVDCQPGGDETLRHAVDGWASRSPM